MTYELLTGAVRVKSTNAIPSTIFSHLSRKQASVRSLLRGSQVHTCAYLLTVDPSIIMQLLLNGFPGSVPTADQEAYTQYTQ